MIDVAIAGNGPAGCAVASGLTSAGKGVVLISPDQVEELMPNLQTIDMHAVELLQQCSVSSRSLADIAVPVELFRRRWNAYEDGSAAMGVYLPRHFLVDRRKLDACLRTAIESAGVHSLSGRVTSALPSVKPDGLVVRCSDGRCLSCKILVDATGRSGHLVRRAGAKLRIVDNLVAWVFEYDHSLGSCEVSIEACDSGWIYAADDGVGRTLVTFVGEPETESVDEVESRVKRSLLAGRKINETARHRRLKKLSASVTYLGAAVSGRIVAVGDASYALDPLSGKGVITAIQNGLALARALVDALDGNTAALQAYETQRRGKITGAHRREGACIFIRAARGR